MGEVQFRSSGELGPTRSATDRQSTSREIKHWTTSLRCFVLTSTQRHHCCRHHCCDAAAAAAAGGDEEYDDDDEVSCRSLDRGCQLHWTTSVASICPRQHDDISSAVQRHDRRLCDCPTTTKTRHGWPDVETVVLLPNCLSNLSAYSRNNPHSPCRCCRACAPHQSPQLPTWLCTSVVSQVQINRCNSC